VRVCVCVPGDRTLQARLFHVPYSCADPSWLLQHPELRPILLDPTTVIRIQGFPKAIERHVAEALIDEDEGGILEMCVRVSHLRA